MKKIYLLIISLFLFIPFVVNAEVVNPLNSRLQVMVELSNGQNSWNITQGQDSAFNGILLNSGYYGSHSVVGTPKNLYYIANLDLNNTMYYSAAFLIRFNYDYNINDSYYWNLSSNLSKYKLGVYNDSNYINKQSCIITRTTSVINNGTGYVDYDVTCYFSSNTTISNAWLSIGWSGAGNNDITGIVPSSSNSTMQLLWYEFKASEDYDSIVTQQNETIINQNQTIIDQNNQTNDKLDYNNQQMDKLNNSITNDSSDFNSGSCGIICKLKNIPNMIINGISNVIEFLFVPPDTFLDSSIDSLSSFLDEKLGFLAFPFTFIVDVLNHYLNLNDTGSYVITINEIKDPFFNHTLIQATSFDLADLLENSTIKKMHDLWFLFINFTCVMAFINLCYKKYCSIFGMNYGDNYVYFTEEDVHQYDTDTGEVQRSWHKSRKTERKKKK